MMTLNNTQMVIGGQEYVAKKLVDAGRGQGNLTLDEEAQSLSADLIRLKRMEYFAKAFVTHAMEGSAEITGKVNDHLSECSADEIYQRSKFLMGF